MMKKEDVEIYFEKLPLILITKQNRRYQVNNIRAISDMMFHFYDRGNQLVSVDISEIATLEELKDDNKDRIYYNNSNINKNGLKAIKGD